MKEGNRELFAHLALAVARYVPEARRDGAVLPAELLNMAVFFADCATVRQGATTFDGSAVPGDSEDMTQRLLLSKREAGSVLGCSMRSVERLIASGALVAVKFEGSTKVRRSDLESYIDGLSAPQSFRDSVQLKESS